MLVHDWASIHAFWSEYQVKSLADGGLANIVPTDQQGVVREGDFPRADAAKVLDLQLAHSHEFVSVLPSLM